MLAAHITTDMQVTVRTNSKYIKYPQHWNNNNIPIARFFMVCDNNNNTKCHAIKIPVHISGILCDRFLRKDGWQIHEIC